MNKPTPLKVSAAVRSCPRSSLDKSREEKNYPPFAPPPQAVALQMDPVPLDVRRLRAEHGSRRQRDLAAVAMAEEIEVLERRLTEEAALRAAGSSPDPCRDLRLWIRARRRLRHSLPPATYRLWIKPLRPAGSVGDCLYLTAPDDIRAWTERRYSSLIAEALSGSPFTHVSFAEPGIAAVGGEG